ncbi:MAG: TRAP transporter small permease [Alphaproteobacteria bacterium]|jgi:TRAP-type C4-dicarboxylate transport system permease small subunit
MIQIFLKAVDGLTRLSAWIAAALLAILALLGMAEILSRALFNYSIPIAFEYSSYMLAYIMFGGSAWALREGGHIRVSLILAPLGEGARRAVDILATCIALAVSVYLTVSVVDFTARTFALGSNSFFPSETPLGIPQSGLAISVALLSLALLARLVRLFLREAPERGKVQETLEENVL